METESQFIHHDGHRVAVLSGNPHALGTPLVLLHGIAGTVHFWPALLPPSVRDHHRWYSIDLPGHFPGALRQEASMTTSPPNCSPRFWRP